MRRRELIAFLSGTAAAWPLTASAQQERKSYRIGWLGNTRLNTLGSNLAWDGFRRELERRGWTEGRNVSFDLRFAAGLPQRFPQLARELVELKVDLIVATSGPAARAAKTATETIPIVFVAVPDPIGQNLVASLARPGGNLTGLTSLTDELIGKRLELLVEAFPTVTQIAYLPDSKQADEQTNRAAVALGLHLISANMQRIEIEDLRVAIAELTQADAWFVGDHISYYSNREALVALINAQRKPAMYPSSVFVRSGGLISYSVNQLDQFVHAARFVDRILRGAKPADLPVEQPTKFELVVNLKTAKELGLAIAGSILARADEVIE